MDIQDKDFNVRCVGEKAVESATQITLRRIAEKEKTRRLLIIISAILVIVAALIMAYVPEQRQATNMIIGIVLLVFAMGSIGASQFVIKGGGFEVSTQQEKHLEKIANNTFWNQDETEKSKPDSSTVQ
jgi:hypothetical protein